MGSERVKKAEIRGLERLSKRDQDLVIERGQQAEEELRALHRREKQEMVQQQERIAASERYIRSKDEHARVMDARDKVAAQLARSKGIPYSEAQQAVSRGLERNSRR